MKLKKGITGFWDNTDKQPIPQIDEKKLKASAYAVNTSTKYKLMKILNPESSSNYYRLVFANIHISEQIDLVVNKQYAFYAGVTPDCTWMQLRFVGVPEEIRRVFDTEFEYLNPDFLNSSFTIEGLKELSDNEKQQIQYWKSNTYGDVIFNGYD
jgi:hypothetical protein